LRWARSPLPYWADFSAATILQAVCKALQRPLAGLELQATREEANWLRALCDELSGQLARAQLGAQGGGAAGGDAAQAAAAGGEVGGQGAAQLAAGGAQGRQRGRGERQSGRGSRAEPKTAL
jgi:hypothetical protein